MWREKSILKIASFLSWWPFCFFQIFLSPWSDQKTITNQIFRLRVFKLRCLALYSANPSIIPIPRRSKSLSWEKEKKRVFWCFLKYYLYYRSLIKKIYHNHNQNLIFYLIYKLKFSLKKKRLGSNLSVDFVYLRISICFCLNDSKFTGSASLQCPGAAFWQYYVCISAWTGKR